MRLRVLMLAVLLAACLSVQSDAQYPVNPLSGVNLNSPLTTNVDDNGKALQARQDFVATELSSSFAGRDHVWIHARSVAAMRKVETEIRNNINHQFHANRIVIAFPQRDLHLGSEDPIEYRWVGDESGREKRSA